MGKSIDNLIEKLDRVENHLAEEIAPEVNKLFQESVRYSLVDYYNDYDPRSYHRIYNFMGGIVNSAKTSGAGNVITMSVSSELMNPYPSWTGKKNFPSDTAFDSFFMGGEHGHGKWMMKCSLPPYMYVDADISDGFGGRANQIMTKVISRVLK